MHDLSVNEKLRQLAERTVLLYTYTPGGKDFPLSPCPPSPCFQHPAHSMINAEV